MLIFPVVTSWQSDPLSHVCYFGWCVKFVLPCSLRKRWLCQELNVPPFSCLPGSGEWGALRLCEAAGDAPLHQPGGPAGADAHAPLRAVPAPQARRHGLCRCGPREAAAQVSAHQGRVREGRAGAWKEQLACCSYPGVLALRVSDSFSKPSSKVEGDHLATIHCFCTCSNE